MSKFDYMNFYGGSDGTEFVVHAKKYNKQQAIELCISENDTNFDGNKWCEQYRIPTDDDVELRRARYYVKIPEFCEYDENGGCYSFCEKNEKGSFPVWVINLRNLEQD